jgi:seryl-tRNA synthetase
MNRKKPKVGDGARVVSRKAVATPSSPVFISMTKADPSKRVSNIAKTLPMSPAEAESHDLITSLQAQLDNLTHRRNNITKSIRQMTELMPTDSVLVTDQVRRKRENEKRKVEGLREEEADVRRQEHDIGLRLHRAWKRKDKEAVYEPTGLWVRRVTG